MEETTLVQVAFNGPDGPTADTELLPGTPVGFGGDMPSFEFSDGSLRLVNNVPFSGSARGGLVYDTGALANFVEVTVRDSAVLTYLLLGYNHAGDYLGVVIDPNSGDIGLSVDGQDIWIGPGLGVFMAPTGTYVLSAQVDWKSTDLTVRVNDEVALTLPLSDWVSVGSYGSFVGFGAAASGTDALRVWEFRATLRTEDAPPPGPKPVGRVYATQADVQAYQEDETATAKTKDLARASRLVDAALRCVPYATDADGMPLDPTVVATLREAVCIQIDYWATTGDTGRSRGAVSAASALGVSYTKGQAGEATNGQTLCSEALLALRNAGLRPQVIVRG